MFFVGENDRRFTDDFRPELHDSDGLLMHTGARRMDLAAAAQSRARPASPPSSTSNPRGFGLMQRDRTFEHYQDLDLGYERARATGSSRAAAGARAAIELVEMPTGDETNDNIVAYWRPNAVRARPGARLSPTASRAVDGDCELPSAAARSSTPSQTPARALGSPEPPAPGYAALHHRFRGRRPRYYLADPSPVQIVPHLGRPDHRTSVPNPQDQGFRAAIDVSSRPGPIGRSARLPARRRAGAHRDLGLSVDRTVSAPLGEARLGAACGDPAREPGRSRWARGPGTCRLRGRPGRAAGDPPRDPIPSMSLLVAITPDEAGRATLVGGGDPGAPARQPERAPVLRRRLPGPVRARARRPRPRCGEADARAHGCTPPAPRGPRR